MRILLCTDGSPEAAKAAHLGMSLARGSHEPIELLGVVEQRQDAEEMRAGLETLGAELQTIGAQCDIKIRHGHAAEQILNEAEAWQADLIVVGQLGRRGLTRFFMGSTAIRIVQFAPCSVLLVKDNRSELHKILVCTAGGEPGLRDVSMAGRVAELAQAAVTVLHVMSQVPLSDAAYLPDLAANADDLIARHTREGLHLEAALKQLRERAPALSSTAKVRHGFVVDEILAELRQGDYDLLVVGAHVARGLNRWLLDDVTAHLIEEATTPVLVVRGNQ
jgi:nucleotide-binding universal stress UspA family protein